GETRLGDLPPSTLRTLRRKLTFVPDGHDYREWQRPRVRTRVICFYFDPAKMPIHADASAGPLAPRLLFENNALWGTASKLAAARGGGGARDGFCKALGVGVAKDLLRSHAEVPRRLRAGGSLAVGQQRAVPAYIEAPLGEPIPLHALAKLVHLSSYY